MAYAYKPLDQLSSEIRLISFSKPKGKGLSTIKCRMKHVAYHDTLGWGDFAAFSYAWGDSENMKYVWIGDRPFRVTANLYDALVRMQQLKNADNEVSSTIPKWFWVDAICINQASIPERNLQVPRMRYIFGSAKTVCCFPVLPALSVKDQSERRTWIQKLTITIRSAGLGQLSLVDEQRSLFNESPFAAFFDDPYWERIWVAQEIALASHPVCILTDGYFLRWRDINVATMVAIATVDRPRRSKAGYLGKPLVQLDLWRSYGRTLDVGNHVSIAQAMKASDPRDKVYSLLSLYLAAEPIFEANYSLDFRLVWRNFMAMSVKDFRTLAALPYSSSRSRVNGLPSWFCYLDKPEELSEFPQICRASSTIKALPGSTIDQDVLHVSGLILDRVDNLTRDATVDLNAAAGDLWKHIRHAVKLNDESPRHDGEHKDEHYIWALLEIFVGPWSGKRRSLPSLEVFSSPSIRSSPSSQAFSRFLQDNHEFLLPNGRPLPWAFQGVAKRAQELRDDTQFVSFMMNHLQKRKLATTMHRRVGLVPEDAQKGDAICALAGLDHLGLLRRKTHNAGKWQWIGRCHVHGLMEGQGVVGRQHEFQWFDII